ncbi:hypothetical protein JX265_010949 [Neoarthrinium moseri]|uniref:Uncharacterized protein n=1 Tax=Neoarthrinium moseri TaxID=1658444 RepID=A0A9P9WD54_9PEZI|nr:uncharacterized protein JN550_009686 [Neoarthrinium moseri]KAI1851715.1 hypothetical protein JX266_003177 [Neoarthrinium moseri]KAI1857919.1 hypothetical protein JX265_010949 [Neoarthrinium moseri]KAI1863366.1 hypothetical protein JN550_009686 [Neoarthrinium moseri]
MPIFNVGSIVIQLVVFVTTLVNFHSALAHVEPVLLIVLYILSKVLGRAPEDFWTLTCHDPWCQTQRPPSTDM